VKKRAPPYSLSETRFVKSWHRETQRRP